MKQFLSSSLSSAIEAVANRTGGCAFQRDCSGFLYRLGMQLERLRPNARTEFKSLTQFLYQRPTPGHEQRIACLLRQPVRDAAVMLASNRLHNTRLERRRNIAHRHLLVRRYCADILIPQREEFLALEQDDVRSRIVASFHIGDFIYGCAKLFAQEAPRRRKFVLSLNNSSQACYSNLSAGFGSEAPGPETELPFLQTSTSKLSQLLRAGNTSILLFCDLPPGIVESIEVRFLDRAAWFSIGPAMLAITNAVPILPLINLSYGEHRYVYLGRQIEPELLVNESLRTGAQRITQELVTFFENFFVGHPEQWRFVSLLGKYLSRPG